jgi:hypothetical protein
LGRLAAVRDLVVFVVVVCARGSILHEDEDDDDDAVEEWTSSSNSVKRKPIAATTTATFLMATDRRTTAGVHDGRPELFRLLFYKRKNNNIPKRSVRVGLELQRVGSDQNSFIRSIHPAVQENSF